MSDLDEFKATYFDECSELLLELEDQFVAIADGERGATRLNAVFRAIHSIKGGAGAFNFTELVTFTHQYETLLDHVRNQRIDLTDSVVSLCIRANDVVADFVAAARNDQSLGPDFGLEERRRFEALSADIDAVEMGGEPMEEFDIEFVPISVDLDAPVATKPESVTGWRIHFTPHRELYARANDPLLLFRELAELGALEIRAIVSDLPPLVEFDPFAVYCRWEIELAGSHIPEDQIRAVFEFVEGDCDLDISFGPVGIASAPADASELEEFADLPSFAELAAEFMVTETAPQPYLLASDEAGLDRIVEDGQATPATARSIRVELEKVDRVANMIGELVIAQSMLNQQVDENLRMRYQDLVRGIEILAQTTRGLQDSVMAIRAQPVKSVFARMPRLLRELAARTGKKMRLEMVGENTEIDKTIIEHLADPLTHMVRNSADHGIESPQARLAAGKPETGTVRLIAEQAGGNILIAVEDDGAGINRERVAMIARDRGIVGENQHLSEEQIDNLIFAPGFSTVAEVSDISGRGVGMDVVLSNIEKIGGSVHVRSSAGKGTRMTLRLPLTLAVLDVMLVEIAASPFVIPLSSIIETIECARAEFSYLPTGGRVLQVRGDYVHVIDLAECFEMPAAAEQKQRFVVLCEADRGTRLALIVDDIIGQQQVVIKSLEQNFERIAGISGGTILGDGSVALIVDVQGLRAVPPRRNAA